MRIDPTIQGVESPANGTPRRTRNAEGSVTAAAGGAASISGGSSERPSGRTSGSTSGSGSNTSGLDQTSLPFDRTRLQSLGARVLAQPEIRDYKVQALQEAIGRGDYSVPPSQVADALVNDQPTEISRTGSGKPRHTH
jgi:flagellar biosynthesis anti-sigma factor FlgM